MTQKYFRTSIILFLIVGLVSCVSNKSINLDRKLRTFGEYQYDFFVIPNANKHASINNTLLYYSFFNGKVIFNKGNYYGNLLHGEFSKIKPNGQLVKKGKFYFGLKTGIWQYWGNQGEVAKVEKWNKGLLLSRVWNREDGHLITENYKNNQLVYQELKNDSLTIKNVIKGKIVAKTDTLKNKTLK